MATFSNKTNVFINVVMSVCLIYCISGKFYNKKENDSLQNHLNAIAKRWSHTKYCTERTSLFIAVVTCSAFCL